MAFNITDLIATRVLVEEVLGQDPTPETFDVPLEYRRRIRKEIAAIRKAGGVVDIPATYPDPEGVPAT